MIPEGGAYVEAILGINACLRNAASLGNPSDIRS